MPPHVCIVYRDTPAWVTGSLTARAMRRFDREISRPIGTTERLVEAWNAVATRPFVAVRAELQRIARAQNARIPGTLTVDVGDLPRLHEPASEPFWIVPIDDDDWLSPDLAKALRGSCPKRNSGVRWISQRLSDGLEARADSAEFCYTNNYAISSRFVQENWMRNALARHEAAQVIFESDGLAIDFVAQELGLTLKHPCSFTTLERRVRFGNGRIRDEVVAHLRGVAACIDRHRLPWAAASLSAEYQVFSHCLGV